MLCCFASKIPARPVPAGLLARAVRRSERQLRRRAFEASRPSFASLWALALLIPLLLTAPLAADVPLDDFEDPSVWSDNHDGGNAPEFTADTEYSRDGKAMRIRYADGPPHWGNLVGPCTVPGDAVALRFWVYRHTAAAGAAMHIWLFEPDNDGWSQRVPFEANSLAEAAVGWHEVRLPMVGFGFQARGAKTREMTAVNRMLIGCNFADLEVTVDSMTWETGAGEAPLPLPRTDGLRVERGDRGSIGILDMGDDLPDGFTTAHPPDKLADVLRSGSFGATILKPGDLADLEILTPRNFDAIILPFGPYFPLDARETFLAYLKAGGSFLSTDGYAFDRLMVLTDSGWSAIGPERTAEEMDQAEDPGPKPSMNARVGKAGDALTLLPEQITVFDPQYRLENATRFRLATWHDGATVRGGPEYDFAGPVAGFSACGLTGQNSPVFPPVYRRWVPVLQALDSGGGLRGTALSIMHNFAGEYPTSSWAFSGLTSGTDLFLDGRKRRALLLRVMADITEKVFLRSLKTDFACYEPGETVNVSLTLANHGSATAERALSVEVGGEALLARAVELGPGETQTVEATATVESAKADFVPVRAVFRDAEGRLLDTIESGFCVRSETVLAAGPKVGWEGNYMTVDGRPTFLVGTNQTGMMYFSDQENPAIWDRDFRTMSEHGIHLLRILHFSPFSKGGYEGKPTNLPLDLVERPKRFVRQMDAIVQLAQKHRVAIFLSLHDWMGTVLTDEELQAQADWNRFWADRYKSVPGIFYDIQNEPGVAAVDRPDIVALWNRFLEQRYGSDEALRAAWTTNPPEADLPNVPLGETTDAWDDVRSADRKRFETELLNRWVKANLDGIRAGDPDAPVCVGYLPSMPPADKILGVKHTDFSNMHYYGPVERFPLEFKLIDRRFQGKGFSLGEFGAREAHNARTAGSFDTPVDESLRRFHTYMHYAAGLGAAFIANWDWKEFDESVFPWGLMQRGSYTTKPWLHTLEQGFLLLSFVQPQYESPEVFILAPDSHRIGPRFGQLHNGLTRAVELLLDQRVNFGMANEEDLADLPASAKAIVWPIPYCPSDETFDRVLDWVKAGGTLYLSGDIAFDRTRQPTRADRRVQLGLPETGPTSPFEVSDSAWQQEPIEASVGQGRVFHAPYPLELRAQPTDVAVYRRLLDLAGIQPIRIEPADAPVRAFSIPTEGGGRLYMLARTDSGDEFLRVTVSEAEVAVDLTGHGFAFIALGPDGQVQAAESQGALLVGGELMAEAQDHFAVCALDGEDLRASRELLVLPHQGERVTLSARPPLAGARCYVGPPAGSAAEASAFKAQLSFAPGAPGYVAVVAPSDRMEAARQLVAGHLTLQPAGRND